MKDATRAIFERISEKLPAAAPAALIPLLDALLVRMRPQLELLISDELEKHVKPTEWGGQRGPRVLLDKLSIGLRVVTEAGHGAIRSWNTFAISRGMWTPYGASAPTVTREVRCTVDLDEGGTAQPEQSQIWYEHTRPGSRPTVPTLSDARAARAETVEPVPTRMGGLRGRRLGEHEAVQGTRVVTESGEHGIVESVNAIDFVTDGRVKTPLTRTVYWDVQLATGRLSANVREVYEELQTWDPAEFYEDILVIEPDIYAHPETVWWDILTSHINAEGYVLVAQSARTPAKKRESARQAARHREFAVAMLRLFMDWLQANPGGPAKVFEQGDAGLDYRLLRSVALELGEQLPRSSHELPHLKALPDDWRERISIGASVLRWGSSDGKTWAAHPATVIELDGHRATLVTPEGERITNVPLYYLEPAGSGPESSAESESTGRRGRAAPSDLRARARELCEALEFDLELHGRLEHIRVVCGQRGRRDVWHNVFVGKERFGLNGVRWARNVRPPAQVLDAIRDRGVMAFELAR